MTLRIRHAQGFPGAIQFNYIYEYEMLALNDGVEIWIEKSIGLLGEKGEKKVVKILRKGERMRGHVSYIVEQERGLTGLLGGQKKTNILRFFDIKNNIYGNILASEVEVKCVPRGQILFRNISQICL